MKWGRVEAGRVTAMAALPYDQPDRWNATFLDWNRPARWHLAGVVPRRQMQLADWLTGQSITPTVIHHADVYRSMSDHGLSSLVERPDRIGIDRLLGVLAGWQRRDHDRPVVTVGVGTATTVDVTLGHGVHQGGVIFPGPALMAKSLHEHTAALPLVTITPMKGTPANTGISFPPLPSLGKGGAGGGWLSSSKNPPSPDPSLQSQGGEEIQDLQKTSSHLLLGRVTETAIAAGIHHAVVGAVERIVGTLDRPCVFITGGDAALFETVLRDGWQIIPTLILDGLALATEAK
jgi:pantothenate kinase type III